MITILERNETQIEDGNILFLNSQIDSDASDYVVRNIIEKNMKDEKDRPDHIKLVINSPGGIIYDCFAIIDAMNAYEIPVFTYGLGLIASCGLLIFLSGAPGNRYLFKNSSLLSHQFWGVDSGKEHELKAAQKENKNVSNKIYKIYQEATGLTKEEISEHLLPPQDVWLTPKEALKFNVCDKIISKFL